jgi:hypothetical protein
LKTLPKLKKVIENFKNPTPTAEIALRHDVVDTDSSNLSTINEYDELDHELNDKDTTYLKDV